jgi:putative membrane protein
MIRGYSDHAANEGTFLAWVRTGIAVIAFGFVIEKFNLFVLTLAFANSLDPGRRAQFSRLLWPLGRYDGLALVLVGTALVAVAAVRFNRTERMIDDQETHSAGGVRAEMILSVTLVFIVAGLSVLLVLDSRSKFS